MSEFGGYVQLDFERHCCLPLQSRPVKSPNDCREEARLSQSF